LCGAANVEGGETESAGDRAHDRSILCTHRLGVGSGLSAGTSMLDAEAGSARPRTRVLVFGGRVA